MLFTEYPLASPLFHVPNNFHNLDPCFYHDKKSMKNPMLLHSSKLCILFTLLCLVGLSVSAQVVKPHVLNLSREAYGAENKNWSIGQDERAVLYVGNDIGLLEFDGIEWILNRLPKSSVIRSVAVLSNTTVFTGSYEEFGRWDRDTSGQLQYTSLSDSLDKKLFKNDDFWKIWITDGGVYFQSFNAIYFYDYQTVERIPSDKVFLFLTKVREEFLVQQMLGPLFRLKGKELEKIEGSELFRQVDVRVILPYRDNQYLIGTATKGFYSYDGKEFREWNRPLSEIMRAKELNCGLRSSRGTYFFGTILDGIYEVDEQGTVLNHISSESTLQNNTVLSLYEEESGNLWVALDRGLSYIQYNHHMSYFTDYGGDMGAVYCGVHWGNRLFIGTNQGVFHIEADALSKSGSWPGMRLVNGTQGQVWAFKLIDGRLFCCHNRGLKEIHPNLLVTDAFSIGTGVYNLSEAQVKGRDLLILSTYNSIRIVDKETQQVYKPGQIHEPVMHAEFDHLGNIWMEHVNRGVYRGRLNDDFSDFKVLASFGGNNDDGLPYKLKLFKVGGRIVLLGDNRFYTYDDIQDKVIPNTLLNDCFARTPGLRQIVPYRDNQFWALAQTALHRFTYDGYEVAIAGSYPLGLNLSLVNAYENMSILNDSTCMVCLDNGFLLYHSRPEEPGRKPSPLPSPFLKAIRALDTQGETQGKEFREDHLRIDYRYNTIQLQFGARQVFDRQLSFRYMLEGVDRDWSQPQQVNKVLYARLPVGKYTFKLQVSDGLGHDSETLSLDFEILPPWYRTLWAYLLYLGSGAAAFYLVWMLVLRRYRNIHLQKIRLRETRRLRALAGELQQEVEQKNAELLTQTSFLIQKNELITKVRDLIDDFYARNKTNAILPLYHKIQALLNNNLDTDNDWKMFLIKFEEKHTGFFKQLKTLYPQLTSTDLRLCACLKLNLESKEIAALMNLSVRAVENSRYRLRKKLNLQPSQNLNEFFLTID